MKVHFIGAGPGAADLITVRGRDILARCKICLYAGSVIPRALLDHCPPETRKIDTAPLSLDEIEAAFVEASKQDLDVARLHSGDLSVFSAVAEQIRRLEKNGISYSLTPGVPAFAAAAASLGRELTLPEISQSLVLTRIAGRASSMPVGESLSAFGRTGSTLAVHLAVHALDRIVDELSPIYGPDCPCIVVAKASWPEEQIIRATLATIQAEIADTGIDRTAIVLIGRSLNAEVARESALYDPDYQRRFRGREL